MHGRIRELLRGVWVAAGVAVLGVPGTSAGPEVVVGRPCDPSLRTSIDQIDHTPFDALLQQYVDGGGLVDYSRWKANPTDLQALESYLVHLGCVDMRVPARRESQLAFWINAYNALTIHGILREYPTKSIRDHTAQFAGYNIWKDLKLMVGDQRYSLNNIEHDILRKMGEPRIHLALVCASRGCPPLVNRAYTAEQLDAQLTENGRRYLADARNFRADPRTKSVSLSRLFEWYGTDFGATAAEQLAALGPMLPPGSEWAARGVSRVQYLDYDWSLNDQRSPRR